MFFHLVIVFVEEPHLRKKHGMTYEHFLSSVPRWLSLRHGVHTNETFASQADGDIIFLGDSITEGCDWAGLFNNPRIKNHGIGGDTSEGILQRLGPIIGAKPEKIFLMVGINDLWNGVPVDTVVGNYRRILTQCRGKTPATRVFLQSVLSMNDGFSSSPARIPVVNASVVALNGALREVAIAFHYSYVDLHPLFLKEGQLDPQFTNDGLHLNASAYMVWKSAIRRFVETNP
jgi:lysophospholipase L1-like esterase